MAQSIDTTSRTIHLDWAPATDAASRYVFNVGIGRTADWDYLVGDVEGHPFRVKGARLETAQALRDRALRTAAMWQAAIDAGLAR